MSQLLEYNLTLESEDLTPTETELTDVEPVEGSEEENAERTDLESELDKVGDNAAPVEDLKIDETTIEEDVESLNDIKDSLEDLSDGDGEIPDVVLESINFSLSLISRLYKVDTKRPRNILAIENFQGGQLTRSRNAKIAAKAIDEVIKKIKR